MGKFVSKENLQYNIQKTKDYVNAGLSGKQNQLISGENIKTINSISLLGNGDIDTREVFYCTYGTTTYSEITTALTLGKIPVCIYNDGLYKYEFVSAGNYVFVCQQLEINKILKIASDNIWLTDNREFEKVSNKVTAISAISTNEQYPSAKCVYDELQLKQNNLTEGSNISITGNVISATDTTYSSLTASEGGTDVSLVTTGEKYNWNNKSTVSVSNTGTATDVVQYITVDGVEKKIGASGVTNGVAYEEIF